MPTLLSLYDRVRRALRYRRNPALYTAIAVMVLLTAWRIQQGMPIEDVLSESYIEYLLITGGALFTRLQVFAPETVDDMIVERDAAADEHEPADGEG